MEHRAGRLREASLGVRDASGVAVSAGAMQQLRTGSKPKTRTV
ncbi:hypothetical protein [Streptomyces sp. NBC_00986]|nr:hypothetical protein OG504_03740 [Streptomyces sp. NBC_00986]